MYRKTNDYVGTVDAQCGVNTRMLAAWLLRYRSTAYFSAPAVLSW